MKKMLVVGSLLVVAALSGCTMVRVKGQADGGIAVSRYAFLQDFTAKSMAFNSPTAGSVNVNGLSEDVSAKANEILGAAIMSVLRGGAGAAALAAPAPTFAPRPVVVPAGK